MPGIHHYIHWGSPPCRGVIMACRIAGIDAKYHFVDILVNEHLKEDFLKINPQHKIPTMVEDDEFILAEGRAIAKYLLEKFAPDHSLYPKDLRKRAVIDMVLDIENEIGLPAVVGHVKSKVVYKTPGNQALWDDMLQRVNDHILDKTPYAAGETLTLADLFLVATVTYGELLGEVDAERFPNVAAWVQRIKAEPFYEKTNMEYEAWKREVAAMQG